MDVFALRDRLTDDYANYASSFIQIYYICRAGCQSAADMAQPAAR